MAEGYLRFAREHPAYFRLFRFPPPSGRSTPSRWRGSCGRPGTIAAHLGPANMDISDAEFEQMLNQARESLIRGLLPTS
jgi:hypothetical protein